MPILTAYYIDEDQERSEREIAGLNAVRIGGSDELVVQWRPPPTDLSLAGFQDAALFFVDYELDVRQANGELVNYRGITLAARLREQFKELPVVLITGGDLLTPSDIRRYTESDLFDDYISKEDIIRKPDLVIARCLVLINGYTLLRGADHTWPGLLEVLEATETDAALIGEAAPPLGRTKSGLEQRRSNAATEWQVSQTAQWIQNVLLRYPGVLYEDIYAATYLGIDVEEFLSPDLQEEFRIARYLGPFAPKEGRWWKDRLARHAQEVIYQAGTDQSGVNAGFGPAFGHLHGRSLKPAVCVYSKKLPADWVCYVLRKPVLTMYSLPYYPDARPKVMEEARVSFQAIRYDGRVIDEFFDTTSKTLVRMIRNWESDEV